MVLAKKCDYFGRDVFNASQVRCFTLLISVHTLASKQLTPAFNASHRAACTLAGRQAAAACGCARGMERPIALQRRLLIAAQHTPSFNFNLSRGCRIFFGFRVFYFENRIGQCTPFQAFCGSVWSGHTHFRLQPSFGFIIFKRSPLELSFCVRGTVKREPFFGCRR